MVGGEKWGLWRSELSYDQAWARRLERQGPNELGWRKNWRGEIGWDDQHSPYRDMSREMLLHPGTWCQKSGLDTLINLVFNISMGWCEFFTTFCLKICISGPHICNFSLPQNREIIGQWPASKRHEPPGGIWNLPGPGLLSAASRGKASSGSSGNEGLEFCQKRGKRRRLGISFPSQGRWPST